MASLAQIVVDVLAGQRSIDQLIPLVTTDVLAAVRRATAPRSRAVRSARDRRIVASTHVQRPAPDVVEAAVVVRGARLGGALALRLEWREGRWRCTAVEALA